MSVDSNAHTNVQNRLFQCLYNSFFFAIVRLRAFMELLVQRRSLFGIRHHRRSASRQILDIITCLGYQRYILGVFGQR